MLELESIELHQHLFTRNQVLIVNSTVSVSSHFVELRFLELLLLPGMTTALLALRSRRRRSPVGRGPVSQSKRSRPSPRKIERAPASPSGSGAAPRKLAIVHR
eukprot:876899-Pyramimonas_sp.AAC.1